MSEHLCSERSQSSRQDLCEAASLTICTWNRLPILLHKTRTLYKISHYVKHLLVRAMVAHRLGLELILSDTRAHGRCATNTARHHCQQAVNVVGARPLLMSKNLL